MNRVEITRVAAYGLCVDDGRLLLARHSPVTPTPGAWSLPGGGIDHGEHPRDAVARELYEETGLRGRPTALLGVDSSQRTRPIGDDLGDGLESYHAVRVLYRVAVETTGPLQIIDAGGSTDDVAWVELSELSSRELSPTARWGLTLIDVQGGPV